MAATAKKADGDKAAKREKVIETLNKARSMELYAITQYMNQHYVLDDLDYGRLAASVKRIAIDEMIHAEMFAERIKDLDGKPTTAQNGTLQKEQDIRKIYPFNADVEDDTLARYNEFARICRECGDTVSQRLFEKIIEHEQKHWNYFDNEAAHIKQLGDVYLATIAGTPSSLGGSHKGFVEEFGGKDD